MNENKKVLTEEEKNKLSHLFAAMVPNGTLSPEDILWIMNEVENGNRNVDFDAFMKAKKERDKHKTCETCRHYTIPYTIDDIDFPCRLCIAHSKWEPEEEKKEESPHFCFRCKHQTCDANEEPCISCNEWPHSGYLNMTSKWEPKEEKKEIHFCKDCKFAENPVFKEPCSSCFKISSTGDDLYHQNWQPNDKEAKDAPLCKTCKFEENPVFKEPCSLCFKKDNDNTYHQNWEIKDEEKESEDICCYNCKHSDKKFNEKPCKTCLIPDMCQPLFFKHQYFEEKDTVDHKDNSPLFGPNMMREEEIKISDSTIIRSIKSHQINLEKTNHAIEDKIDKLTEALESVNSKLDILDQRMRDLRQHQILKDTKCVTQVKEANKDILEKLNNIEQVVMKNSIGINTTYEKASAVHDEVCKDEDICKDCNYYGMCSSYEGDMIYCKDFKKKDIADAKEPPKFKAGDIVKMTDDPKQNDFFVCRIKWSEHSKQWNYFISSDLEDISSAFWRMEKWLTKSEDHSEPLFKVGDKVKLKAGTTVYTVLSVTHFMCGDRKVYRYRISHSATTPHYENENRLIKA